MTTKEAPQQTMYYIGLDGHKRTVSYCVKNGSDAIYAEGTIPATRFDLDRWMKPITANALAVESKTTERLTSRTS